LIKQNRTLIILNVLYLSECFLKTFINTRNLFHRRFSHLSTAVPYRTNVSYHIIYHVIYIFPSTDRMQDNKNSMAKAERQLKPLLHPSQEKQTSIQRNKHKINEKWNTQTQTHEQ